MYAQPLVPLYGKRSTRAAARPNYSERAGQIVVSSHLRNPKTGRYESRVLQTIQADAAPSADVAAVFANSNIAASSPFTAQDFIPEGYEANEDEAYIPLSYEDVAVEIPKAEALIDYNPSDDEITRDAHLLPSDSTSTRLDKLFDAGARYVTEDFNKSANDLKNKPKYNIILYQRGDHHRFVLKDDGRIIDAELDPEFRSWKSAIDDARRKAAKEIENIYDKAKEAINNIGNALGLFDDSEWSFLRILIVAGIVLLGGGLLVVLIGEIRSFF